MKTILIPVLFAVSLIISGNAFPQATDLPVRNGLEFSPRWIDNLMFLNNFDRPLPVEKQMLYKWAEAKLAGNKLAGFSGLADYKAFQEYCRSKNIIHLGGPMLGNITENSADIWIRTAKPGKVIIKIIDKGNETTFGPAESKPETELSAVVRVTGLKSGTRYPYRVFVDGVEIPVPEGASVRTLPGTDQVDTRIAFGSCFHRWGLGNEKQSRAIVARQPHAMLFTGDVAVQDRQNNAGWHSLDYLARDLYPAWQNLAAKIPVYDTWDDHDYFDNDMWGIPKGFTEKDKENVRNVHRWSWTNPSCGFGEEGKGIFFHTRIGSCDVIMLDHRYFRTKESFLGPEQLKWLEEQLVSCKGPFIILSCGTMWSDYVSDGKDSWGEFDPAARERIFSLIEKKDIKGVLLISGDRHGARGFRIPRPSGYNFYEFEVASLGGITGPPESKPEWETQFYGINGKYAFGEFTFDTKVADPTVTFCLIGENGDIIYSMTLKRSQLTPSNYLKK